MALNADAVLIVTNLTASPITFTDLRDTPFDPPAAGHPTVGALSTIELMVTPHSLRSQQKGELWSHLNVGDISIEVRVGQNTKTTDANVGNTTSNPDFTVFGSGQVTLTGNVDALAGVDISGGALTMIGTNIDLDPTGTFSLNMGSLQTVIITIDDNLGADAFTLKDSATTYLDIDTTTGSQRTQFPTAARFEDDIICYFGSDDDFSLYYDETTSDALILDGGAAGIGTTAINSKIIVAEPDATEFPMVGNGLLFFAECNGSSNTQVINSETDNSAGTALAAAQEWTGVRSMYTQHGSDDAGSFFYAFKADVGGALNGTATGLKVTGDFDVGIDVDSGGAFIAEGVTIESAISGTMGLQMDSLDIGSTSAKIGNIYQASYIQQDEMSDPGDPGADAGRIYMKDVSSSTELFFRNTAGEHQITGAGAGSSLDAAYTVGRAIDIDLGSVTWTHNTIAQTGAAHAVDYSAVAFTGRPHGLSVDMNGATSITNASDVYGVYLRGKALAGGGSSVGVRVDTGWDVGLDVNSGSIELDPTEAFSLSMDANKTAIITIADNLGTDAFTVKDAGQTYIDIDTTTGSEKLNLLSDTRLADDTPLLFGDGVSEAGDYSLAWITSPSTGLGLAPVAGAGNEDKLWCMAYLQIFDAVGDPMPTSTTNSPLWVDSEASSATGDLSAVYLRVDNSAGTGRTADYYSGIRIRFDDHTGDAVEHTYRGYYVQADTPAGSSTFTGLHVGTNIDTAIFVESGIFDFDGSNIDLDPTGTFALNMDAAQTVILTIADNLGTDAFTLKDSDANTYIDVDTTTGSERTQFLTSTRHADSVSLYFGDSDDVQMRWDTTDMDVLALADDQVWKWGNGTNSWDMWWYGNTAADTIVFNASDNIMYYDGVDIYLGDDDLLAFGDAPDLTIRHNGTNSLITNATGDLVVSNTGGDLLLETDTDSEVGVNQGLTADATGVAAGDAACISTTTNVVTKADATTSTGLQTVVGIVLSAATAGGGEEVEWAIPGTIVTVSTDLGAGGDNATNGTVMYLSETAGAITKTAPTASGSTVYRVGVVVDQGNDRIMYMPQFIADNP